MTPLDQALENHMSRFSVRKKKSISDDGPTILAGSAPVISTESNAMTPLDQALENHMNLILGARQKRSLPTTMADGGGDLIKAITNCEGALAELRRALVASFEYLGQQTMSPPVDQATKSTVKA